jgi:hypothetical protein
MDINSQNAMAQKLSIPQLEAAVRNGTLESFIAIPLIAEKTKLANAAKIGQQPTSSVKEQVLQQAGQGVAQLPSNLPEEGMAGGGIVAFADGGDAEDFDYDAYVEQQDEDEYANSLSALVAAAQAAAKEGVSTKKKDKKYADGGIARLNDGGFLEPIDFGAELDRARALVPITEEEVKKFGTMGASGNPEDFKAAREALLKAKQSEKLLQGQYELNMANSPEARPANYADVLRARPTMNGGRNVPQLPNIPYAPPSATPMLPPVVVTPENASPEPNRPLLNEVDYSMNLQEGTGRLSGEMPKAGIDKLPAANTANPAVPGAPRGGTTPAAVASQAQTGKPRSAYDDFLDEIKAGREDLKTQAEKDKYMALISAGLGMMSGTSPNAFANIGQGAQAGVASYMASGKQRAAEKAALNKNLLMGRRYQSMEDIAARTADIQERRIDAIAAARGAGSGASTKAENLERQKLNDIGNLYQRRYATLSAAAQKIDPMLDKEGYAAAMKRLQDDPLLNKYNSIIESSLGNMYGITSEAPPTSTPSNVMRFDAKGQLIK